MDDSFLKELEYSEMEAFQILQPWSTEIQVPESNSISTTEEAAKC